MISENRLKELREASGEVSYSDPLTTFFYLLMRNEVAAGKVESLVREVIDGPQDCLFTNGWLANYANNLADEIRNAKEIGLVKSLEKVFDSEEKDNDRADEVVSEIMDELKSGFKPSSTNIEDDALAELEKKLISIAGHNGVIGDKDEKDALIDTVDAANEAKKALQTMVDGGFISKEDADKLRGDVDEVVAEEVVAKTPEEEKMTTEEAEEMVESAVEASDNAEEFDMENSVRTHPVEEDIDHGDLSGLVNDSDDLSPQFTLVSDKKKSMPETLIDIANDAKPGEIAEAVKNQMEEWTKAVGGSKEKVLEELDEQLDEEKTKIEEE